MSRLGAESYVFIPRRGMRHRGLCSGVKIAKLRAACTQSTQNSMYSMQRKATLHQNVQHHQQSCTHQMGLAAAHDTNAVQYIQLNW